MQETPAYLTMNSFLGPLTAVYKGPALCFLGFGEKAALEAVRLWPTATKTTDSTRLATLLNQLTAHSTPPLSLEGTPFQRAVWAHLATIPAGSVTTYKEVATQLGRPTAVRAVANAIGQNPVSFFLPCHRVIGSDGTLRGYRWGLAVKKKLLDFEQETLKTHR